MKGWSELCDENVVAEFPFAPEGSPTKIEGRAALYEYLRNYPSVIDVRAIPTLNTYATDDPNVAIAEWHASGRVIGNGHPYENELRNVRDVPPRSHCQLSRILESDGVHCSDGRNSLRQRGEIGLSQTCRGATAHAAQLEFPVQRRGADAQFVRRLGAVAS